MQTQGYPAYTTSCAWLGYTDTRLTQVHAGIGFQRQAFSRRQYFPFFSFLCCCCTHSMQKFLGQGSDPHHSSDLSHSSDITGSLTAGP